MFFGSQESLVGLDIGSASIKILQLQKSKGKHKVERFGIKAFRADGSVSSFMGPRIPSWFPHWKVKALM